MYLIIKASHQKHAMQPLENKFSEFPITVGRAGSCDMVLPDTEQFVSSRHLQISSNEQGFFVTDTSSNGTFINDASVPLERGNKVLLCNGDKLNVGEFQLQVTIETGPSSAIADNPFDAISPDAPTVNNTDPFAGLAAATNPDRPPESSNRHVDKLEDIGIGPSAWDTNDDPFRSLDESSRAAVSSGQNTPSDSTDQWAGWLDDIPDPRAGKPAQQRPPQSAAPIAPAAHNNNDAINQLLAAAGLNPADFAHIDKSQLARHIGKLLNHSTQSMMLLLRSRDEIKNAMRAEVTLLAAKGNNPLKFSVSVDEALSRLLTPSPDDGFTAADKALEKALEDIKIHQIAMLEAMRASVHIALSHFEPELLEQRMNELNRLSSTIPLAREAKLWEHFKTRYAEIKNEALDDFGNSFGDELRSAYEASVNTLKN